MNVLNLKKSREEENYSPDSDGYWIAGLILAIAILASTIAFNEWLDSGCQLQGRVTWHGKVCIK